MRTLFVVLVLGYLAGPTWAGPYAPLASGNRCLEVSGTKLFSADCNGSPKQQWKLTAVKGGYVQITSQPNGDGKCLDIVNDNRSNNRLTLTTCSNVSGQHWKLTPVDGRGVTLTTEWRGDGKCLDIVDSTANIQPVLSDCAKSATQSFNVGAADSKVKDRAAPLDATFEPTFFVMFENCAFALPGTTSGKPWTILACTRATKQRAVCRVKIGHLDEAFQPSRSVFEATITTDTAKTLAFATSDDDISVRVNMKANAATLTQRAATVTCTKGLFGTAAGMREVMKEIKRAAARDEPRQDVGFDGPADSAPSPSRSTPEPKKPKGLAHGRMCGRDSECESGSCKMENRTRGRCS